MAPPPAPVIETDALIIGAGPVGLFQVFQLGLQAVKVHVVDALPGPGGQCAELYADKPIYDIPALLVCTGRELADKLMAQIAPFGAHFHWNQVVTALQKQADGRFLVETSQSQQFLCKTVFIAAGVGAFQPRTLHIDGLAAFAGTQLLHSLPDTLVCANRNVVVFGDGDAALESALKLCAAHPDGHPHKAKRVTLVHRRDVFSAAPQTVERFRALVQQGHIHFVAGQAQGIETVNERLTGIQILDSEGQMRTLPLEMLLVLQGLSPKLGPVAQWGLDMERKQLLVDTEKFATSEPGIFAVGDINTYPGKKKLILCGFHEATLAAFGAMPFIAPDKKVMLQYTTTSPKLHKLLGVAPQVPDAAGG
ncbi:MAG: NAD(P)/FAD-dependent oxidoreductase [Pseudomonadota bacterium]